MGADAPNEAHAREVARVRQEILRKLRAAARAKALADMRMRHLMREAHEADVSLRVIAKNAGTSHDYVRTIIIESRKEAESNG